VSSDLSYTPEEGDRARDMGDEALQSVFRDQFDKMAEEVLNSHVKSGTLPLRCMRCNKTWEIPFDEAGRAAIVKKEYNIPVCEKCGSRSLRVLNPGQKVDSPVKENPLSEVFKVRFQEMVPVDFVKKKDRVHCPVCYDGVVHITVSQKTGKVVTPQRCDRCGQLYQWLDIEELNDYVRSR